MTHTTEQLARDTTAHLSGLQQGDTLRQWLAPPPRRAPSVWIIAAVFFGMLLAAVLVHGQPIARTADAMVNPHFEGFE